MRFRFAPAPFISLFFLSSGLPEQGMLHIQVREAGKGVPCRVTIVDSRGQLVELAVAKRPRLAIRKGVVYTAEGTVDVGLPAGEYTIYATRGPLYSLAQKRITVGSSDQKVDLSLTREVDLPGYVSCDTHIHSLTFSGHGDSTGEERLVTLAGEQIDLPISTEHNRQIDYVPLAKATGTSEYLTPVVGNEVTTPVGHFNAFPLPAGGTPPAFDLKDRAPILSGIRAAGPLIVTFNHTHDVHSDFRPDAAERFHALSGESLDGQPWDVDAIEVINSSAQQSDPMRLFRNWFALLNTGKPVVAVGSSDSHDVNAYIVGQARTYISSSATRPDRIDIGEACRNLKAGKALVSLGLVTEMWVDDRFGVGDLATSSSNSISNSNSTLASSTRTMKVHVRVRGPQWMTTDRVELYSNGALIASRPIIHSPTAITKADITFTLSRPAQDAWLVAIASGPGPGDSAPYWPLSRPYQPTLAYWEPRVIGATNPIRVDGDGDGKYTSPREYAARLVDANASDLKKLFATLEGYDPAVTVQAVALLRQRRVDLDSAPVRQAAEAAGPAVTQAFKAYVILWKREKE